MQSRKPRLPDHGLALGRSRREQVGSVRASTARSPVACSGLRYCGVARESPVCVTRASRVTHREGKPYVGDYRSPGLQQDVLRREVAADHDMLVRVFERAGERLGEPRRLVHRTRRPAAADASFDSRRRASVVSTVPTVGMHSGPPHTRRPAALFECRRAYGARVASQRPRWTTESGLVANMVADVPTSLPSFRRPTERNINFGPLALAGLA